MSGPAEQAANCVDKKQNSPETLSRARPVTVSWRRGPTVAARATRLAIQFAVSFHFSQFFQTSNRAQLFRFCSPTGQTLSLRLELWEV